MTIKQLVALIAIIIAGYIVLGLVICKRASDYVQRQDVEMLMEGE